MNFEEMVKAYEEMDGAEFVKKLGDDKALFKDKSGRQFIRLIDGTPLVRQFGDYVEVKGEFTDEKKAAARKEVINKICEELHRLAELHPEWMFIEKEFDGFCTVGFKFAVQQPGENKPITIAAE
ncbi:MAG: hypothetical protein IKB07_08210 [Lachnospiraceae bacterium]|nr:hypothetical protein [Lachnospiraceae bacterium]